MDRKTQNAFANGNVTREDQIESNLAIFEITSDASQEILLRVDRQEKTVRGIYRAEMYVIPVASVKDLRDLLDMMRPNRPTDLTHAAHFDRMVGKIDQAILDCSPTSLLIN